MSVLDHETHSIRHAQNLERRRPENLLGGDPHDVAMPMCFTVWTVVGDVLGHATIRAGGRVAGPACLFSVRRPDQSRGPWDHHELITTTPAEEAWGAAAEGGCPLAGMR